MTYELHKILYSSNITLDFLNDIEKYVKLQAENLSSEYSKYIENEIDSYKKRINLNNEIIKEGISSSSTFDEKYYDTENHGFKKRLTF